jgi:hypothetical protein
VYCINAWVVAGEYVGNIEATVESGGLYPTAIIQASRIPSGDCPASPGAVPTTITIVKPDGTPVDTPFYFTYN